MAQKACGPEKCLLLTLEPINAALVTAPTISSYYVIIVYVGVCNNHERVRITSHSLSEKEYKIHMYCISLEGLNI